MSLTPAALPSWPAAPPASGNGISASPDFGRYGSVNFDFTINLLRRPVGERTCPQSRSAFDGNGCGLAETALYDEVGRLAERRKGWRSDCASETSTPGLSYHPINRTGVERPAMSAASDDRRDWQLGSGAKGAVIFAVWRLRALPLEMALPGSCRSRWAVE